MEVQKAWGMERKACTRPSEIGKRAVMGTARGQPASQPDNSRFNTIEIFSAGVGQR